MEEIAEQVKEGEMPLESYLDAVKISNLLKRRRKSYRLI
jgi:hypothetical protein